MRIDASRHWRRRSSPRRRSWPRRRSAPTLRPRRRRPAPAAAQTDAAYEAARAAFEALPEAERKAIQEALVWTGDHIGVTTGGFGRRTFEAIVAYQKRGAAQARRHPRREGARRRCRAAAQEGARTPPSSRSSPTPGPASRSACPQAVLPKRDVNPNGGSRWQSADGKITLDTRAFTAGETDLPALYERNLAIQTPGRQVTYKVLRPDFFVVSGETADRQVLHPLRRRPGRRARLLARLRQGGWRRAFDTHRDRDREQLHALPGGGERRRDRRRRRRPARPIVEPPRPTGPIATGLVGRPAHRRDERDRRGLRGAAGRARARCGSCKADKAAGLALLEVEAPRRATPPGVRTDALGADTGVVALFYAGTADLAVVPGETGSAATLVAPLQPGATGAPVFDRAGRLAGLSARCRRRRAASPASCRRPATGSCRRPSSRSSLRAPVRRSPPRP